MDGENIIKKYKPLNKVVCEAVDNKVVCETIDYLYITRMVR